MKQRQLLKLLIGLFLMSLLNTVQAKIITPNDLIDRSTMECSFSTEQSLFLSEFYGNLLKNKISNKNIHNKLYNINQSDFILSGFNYISQTTKNIDNSQSKSTNLDLDFLKYGIRILRISVFSENMQGDENFGYYFILHGKLNANKVKLENAGISLDNIQIEDTKARNTRLRCILVG